MTSSGSVALSIQQLWELSRWNDLVPPLDEALSDVQRYSGEDLLILCTVAIQVGRFSGARELLLQALSAGTVSKKEAARFLIGGSQKSLCKLRAELPSSSSAEVGAFSALKGGHSRSGLTRWYQPQGDPVVYVSSQLTESPLTEVDSECSELARRLQVCSDRSLGSLELREAVSDSGYEALFSPDLADVLRPFSGQFEGRQVLALDSQGGAQARFLAECGALVTAVACKPGHALFTAALCADLPNVQVVLDAPPLVPFRELYDIVVLAGYQEVFLAQSEVLSPLDHLLGRAYSALAANGSLILAGHNALALAHFNNQRDAYGREGVAALEGRFGASRSQLLSSSMVAASLARCGFWSHEHCAVMGSIKRPQLMVSPEGCGLPVDRWNLETLVRRSIWSRDVDRLGRFSESRVMQAVVQGGELQAWSDGYLILSHKSPESQLCIRGWLASYFTCGVEQSARQERRFGLTRSDEGSVEVTTHSILGSDGATAEPYINGVIYRDDLDDLLQMPGWTFEQVLQWSAVWLRCLLSSLASNDSLKPEGESAANYQGHYDLWVPEWLLGATPERWVKTAEGDFKCLHKPSSNSSGTLPMAAVLFAGLTSVFSSIRSVAEPADNTWLRPELLAVVLIDRLGFAIDREDIDVIRGEWERVNYTRLPNAGYFQPREVPRALTDAAKLYWATETEGFSEERTSTDILMFDGSLQTLVLPIAAADQKLKALRFDVANRPGCFEIEDMSVVDAHGGMMWRWRHLRDGLSNIQGASLVADVEAGRSCVLSRGDDPQFVLNIPQTVLDTAAGGLLQVTLSAWPQRL